MASDELPSSSSSAAHPSHEMTVEERYHIIRSVGEECLQEDELKALLASGKVPICYDGFEPSGRMHIAQGIMKTINVNKLTSAGCRFKILIADLFAKLNKKMEGDLDKIKTVGLYLIEVWKAAGMNVENVEFLWSSTEIDAASSNYWSLVMDIALNTTSTRLSRCIEITGRKKSDEIPAAQTVFYPCMQCADIFFLEVDICQMGMDQRKVNVLAREYCDEIKRKKKPIILSHHMLPGLKKGQEKMSKSDPSSSIFMEDEESEVNSKINGAYCPIGIVEGNPCIEYLQYIVFPWFGKFELQRDEEYGGNKIFNSVEELIEDYQNQSLHPKDLKASLAKAINEILQPVRDHFETNSEAKKLRDTVRAYTTTKK